MRGQPIALFLRSRRNIAAHGSLRYHHWSRKTTSHCGWCQITVIASGEDCFPITPNSRRCCQELWLVRFSRFVRQEERAAVAQEQPPSERCACLRAAPLLPSPPLRAASLCCQAGTGKQAPQPNWEAALARGHECQIYFRVATFLTGRKSGFSNGERHRGAAIRSSPEAAPIEDIGYKKPQPVMRLLAPRNRGCPASS